MDGEYTHNEPCPLKSSLIKWEIGSKIKEHNIQQLYNYSHPCILHTKSARELSVRRRIKTSELFKDILEIVHPEQLIDLLKKRGTWNGCDAYNYVNTLCPLTKYLKSPIFGLRSKLCLSHIMPKYLSDCRSICARCIPEDAAPHMLDFLINEKMMKPLPVSSKRLLTIGWPLNKRHGSFKGKASMKSRIESNFLFASHKLNYSNMKFLTLDVPPPCNYDVTTDSHILNMRSTVVEVAKQLAIHYRNSALKKNPTRSAGSDSQQPPLLRTIQLSRYQPSVVEDVNVENSTYKNQPILESKKTNVFNTFYDENAFLEVQDKSINLKKDYCGDVWNQMQVDQQSRREKQEGYFATESYPSMLNPYKSLHTTVNEAQKEDKHHSILVCMMKYPKHHLDVNTFITRLEPLNLKTYFPMSNIAKKPINYMHENVSSETSSLQVEPDQSSSLNTSYFNARTSVLDKLSHNSQSIMRNKKKLEADVKHIASSDKHRLTVPRRFKHSYEGISLPQTHFSENQSNLVDKIKHAKLLHKSDNESIKIKNECYEIDCFNLRKAKKVIVPKFIRSDQPKVYKSILKCHSKIADAKRTNTKKRVSFESLEGNTNNNRSFYENPPTESKFTTDTSRRVDRSYWHNVVKSRLYSKRTPFTNVVKQDAGLDKALERWINGLTFKDSVKENPIDVPQLRNVSTTCDSNFYQTSKACCW